MATVTFHGVRGSCPCSDPRMRRYGGATACVSVQPDDDVPPVVLDLGTGSRLLGEELVARYFPGEGLSGGAPSAGNGGPATTGTPDGATAGGGAPANAERATERPPATLSLSVFVSHLHFDHVQGLPFFGPALRSSAALDIFGPKQDSGSLSEAFAAFVQPPYFPVGLDALPAKVTLTELDDADEVAVGQVRVLARVIPHVGRTLGYRVECDGRAIAYLGDHQAPRPEETVNRVAEPALDLAHDVDVLIHDAQYTPEEFGVKVHWGHSTVEYAVEVALAAGAKKLVLFHHDPTHDDDLLDQLGVEASERAGSALEVQVAAEGLALKLNS